jgi:hypothetical protein
LYQIIYITIASVWFAELTNIPTKIKWVFNLKSLKPFDCPLCLAFWLQLITSIALKENYHYAPITSALACIISMTIKKIFK